MKLQELFESFASMAKAAAKKDAAAGHTNSRPKDSNMAKEYDKAHAKELKKIKKENEKKEREERIKSNRRVA